MQRFVERRRRVRAIRLSTANEQELSSLPDVQRVRPGVYTVGRTVVPAGAWLVYPTVGPAEPQVLSDDAFQACYAPDPEG